MKKFVKKALSIALALVMCAGMVAPAFAANFTDLQDAINGVKAPDPDPVESESPNPHANGTKFKKDNDETDYYGYGWSQKEGEETGHWGIEAWDKGNIRNVTLIDNVVRDDNDIIKYQNNRTEERKVVNIGLADKELVLDLNGQTVDGNFRDMDKGTGTVYGMMLMDFGSNATTTIKNGTITGSNKDGIFAASGSLTLNNVSVINNKGNGISVRTNTFKMFGGSVKDNDGRGLSFATSTNNAIDCTVDGTTISGNAIGVFFDANSNVAGKVSNANISGNTGRALFIAKGSSATLDHVTIQNNAGGIITEGQLTLNNSTIVNNHAPETASHWSQKTHGGGIVLQGPATLNLGDGNEIHSNTSNGGTTDSDIYAAAGTTINGLNKTPKAPEDKQFDGWYTENGEGNKYEGPAEIEEAVDLVGNLSDVPENPTPIVPGDGYIVDTDDAAEDPDETEIADPAVPLAAGPVTRAEFIDYLWRHEGEPASDGVCTFTDVPEDHEYVLALAWAEQNEVAFPYEDGTFEPDELVTVSAVREFLGNFETVFGRQAVAASALTTLTGADDEAVLNCDEVLAEFFGA